MQLYIILAVVLIVAMYVVVVVVRNVRKQRRARAETAATNEKWRQDLIAALETWMTGIESATDDAAIVAIGDFEHRRRFEEDDRLKAAYDKFSKARQNERRRKEIEAFRKQYEEATNATEHAELCIKLYTEHYTQEVIGIPKEQVGARVSELMAEERALLQGGDVHALFRYLSFVKGIDWQYSNLRFMLSDEERKLLVFPENWDELVTKLVQTPSLSAYQSIDSSPLQGEVRMMAAQALREESLYLGKLVLAFCSVRDEVLGDSSGFGGGRSRQAIWPYKNEIGCVLLAEVTKMVDRIHVEQGLFSNVS